ncbi:MAG: AMP-binding protein [Acidobacteria bacterium]|nr:AMP-binding protein [Acidobacteriota bacterium]
MPASFCERLVDSLESHSSSTAMRIVGSDAATYTFGELLDQLRSIAWRLGAEGVAKGERIALIGENHPKWAISYLGTVYHGAVIVPLDPHGEIETITNFLNNSEAKAAFLSPDQIERFVSIRERLGHDIKAVVWDMETDVAGFDRFEDWAATRYPEEFISQIPEAHGPDMAVLMYTSGTTGTPKGVPLTHANILAELEGVNHVLELTDKEKILSLLPLFHNYLQIVNLWIATTYGCEVGYLKELTPDELSKAMKEFKPTILTTVPRLWYLFHKKIFDAAASKPKIAQMLFRLMLALNGALRNTAGINLGRRFFSAVHQGFGGRLRIATSAGSRFDEAVAIDFHKLGFTIIQAYGLTETSGAATATHENDNRVGSVGKPMRGAEIKIADPDAEGVGEVLIKGPMVFSGYNRNPEATAETFTEDGWLRSGDLGKLVDGHLYIVGRGKDVIVLSSGKNVHPEDLEVHYLKCPMVADLAVIGITDESEGRSGAEKLTAVVVPDFEYLKLEKIANSKEAIRHALDSLGRELPEYQRVRDYIIRAEPLPRTATRKIKRFQLKKEIESGVISTQAKEVKAWTFTDADNALMETPTAAAVVTAIRQNAKEADIVHPAMSLELDLGLDSLARAETFAALEQAFDIEFENEEAATTLDVAGLIGMVNKYAGEHTAGVTIDLNWDRIVREADDDLPEIRGILRSRPFFSTFAWCVYKCFYLFCKVFMRLEVTGRSNLTAAMERKVEKGGLSSLIICPNHQSFLDPFVLCSSYDRRLFSSIFHVGASEFFENRAMQFLARLLNVVPVNPDTELMRAMKAGAVGLKHGKILNIYPEGERAFDGELHSFKKGAAILAQALDVPIVPVALDGLYKVWPRGSARIRPAKVTIMIGEPFYAEDVIKTGGTESGGSIDDHALITEHLKCRIAEMIDQMRGNK